MFDDAMQCAACSAMDAHVAPGVPLSDFCAIQHAILTSASHAILATDPEGVILYVNRRFQKMFGYSWPEVVGRPSPEFLHISEELTRRAAMLSVELRRRVEPGFAALVAKLDKDGHDERDWNCLRKDGSRLPVRLVMNTLRDDQGSLIGYVGIALDISQRRQMEQELRIAATAFESQAAIMVTDAGQRILRVNPAFAKLTGYSAEEAVGQTPRLLKSGYQDATFYRDLWRSLAENGHWQGEIWNRRKNGEIYPEWLTISAVYDELGELTHYVSTFSDITNLKVAESEIHNLAFYDPLTGLPNRRLLFNRLEKAMRAGRRSGQHGAVLIIDLDNFKTLNDTLGHDAGDRLLVEVAKRLKACVRESDTAARQGGDEFVVLLEDLGVDTAGAGVHAEMVAENIRRELALPHMLEGDKEYFRSGSIGISLFRGRDKTAEALIKQADIALYKAKDAGRNTIHFFDEAMQTAIDHRAALEAGLRDALVHEEFVLHLQPQVDSAGRLIGAESLIRWQPAGKPAIGPDSFIPLAEETGLIVPIGQWVLDTACAYLRRWADDPLTRDLFMSVNVSARQFRQDDFVAQVTAALAMHGADPCRLKLELTESLLLDNVDAVVGKMQALRELGVRFSLDDFGTGYASLSYLKRFPFEQLKIDRSFVRDIATDADDAAIVAAIVAMGNALRLSVVAEGVEEVVQRDFLVERGCLYFQGYLFGRPVPFADFTRYLLPRGEE